MAFVLGIRASRTLAVLFILLALSCAFVSSRRCRADSLSRSGNLKNLNCAVEIDPENAEHWRQLGLLRLYAQNDVLESLLTFHRATDLNPRDADSWIGAAYAYQYLDDPVREREALAKAITVAPKRLEVVWQAANLYAVLGDPRASLHELCIIIEHDRIRADAAIQLARRIAPVGETGAFTCDSSERAP